jgi:hypothetical protein
VSESQKILVPWPFGGQDRGQAFTDQPVQTYREGLNVLGVDPVTTRKRGGPRAGQIEYISPSAAISTGGVLVRRLESVTINDRQLTYSLNPHPPAMWSQASPSSGVESPIVRCDPYGDLYFADGNRAIVKTNSDGVELWRQPLDVHDSTHIITALAVDPVELSFYVGIGSATNPLSSGSQTAATLSKYQLSLDGQSYELAWVLGNTGGVGRYFADALIYQGELFTLEVDWSPASPSKTSKVVRYANIDLPVAPQTGDVTMYPMQVSGTNGVWDDANKRNVIGHSLALRVNNGIEFIVAGTDGGPFSPDTEENFFLCKLNLLSNVVWRLRNGIGATDPGGGPVASPYINGTGGIGFGCAVDSEGNIISIGHTSGAVNEGIWARRIVDNGTTASTSGAGTWSSLNVFEVLHEYPRYVIDAYDNSYLPYAIGTASGTKAVRVFTKAGVELTGTAILGSDGSGNDYARSTAIPPAGVPYSPDLRTDDVKCAEFVYVSGHQLVAGDPVFHKRRLLDATQTSGSVRDLRLVAIAPPDVRVFEDSFVVTPSGGAGAFSAGASYVSAAIFAGKLFMSDGLSYKYLDAVPSTANPNGQVLDWQSKSTGAIPVRGRLLFPWRARVGVGRTPDDPHNFYLSEQENPFGWDFNAVVPSVGDAIAGNLSSAGLVPDLPNSFCPYSDDLLFVFCDHSIWRITGSPLKGGEIDKITSIVGGSFGKCWCFDPEGNVYWHGARGGIYTGSPQGGFKRISTDSIDQDLAEIDTSANYVELHWSDYNGVQGIHVFVFPFGAGGTIRQAWFFERRTGGWHPQKFGSDGATGVQPTAALVLDGDGPSDRVVLVAGEDGIIGALDPTAKSDRGYPIQSSVLIGPLVAPTNRRIRMTELEVTLASDQSGCGFELYASDVPDDIGDAVQSGELVAGFNRVRVRARARYIFLRLFNGIAGKVWRFESATIKAYPAGRVHAGT